MATCTTLCERCSAHAWTDRDFVENSEWARRQGSSAVRSPPAMCVRGPCDGWKRQCGPEHRAALSLIQPRAGASFVLSAPALCSAHQRRPGAGATTCGRLQQHAMAVAAGTSQVPSGQWQPRWALRCCSHRHWLGPPHAAVAPTLIPMSAPPQWCSFPRKGLRWGRP